MAHQEETRVLVLGASGMLGNAMLRLFSGSAGFRAMGTLRSGAAARLFPAGNNLELYSGIDAENPDIMAQLLHRLRPDAVINCVGLIKQLPGAEDPLAAIAVNALLPHRLARLCALAGARLIHISTDCVFSGSDGMYTESSPSDAQDLYGRSKYLGEVDYENALTLRTSIIGHELGSANGLVEWFLAQEGEVSGYRKAVFSGLPTVELAKVIRDYVIPRPDMRGLYHVSAEPVNKYDLLKLVASVYGKSITIHADDKLVIDRSLSSVRFRAETGYQPPPWAQLIQIMREFA